LCFSLAPWFISTAEMACVKMTEVVICPFLIWVDQGEEPRGGTYLGGAVLV